MGQTLHDGGIFLIRCGVWNGCLQYLFREGITLLPFLIVLINFLNEDLHAEEEKMRQKPHGH